MVLRRTLLVAGAVLAFASTSPMALGGGSAPTSPAEFIESLADKAIDALTVGDITRQQRVARFRSLLREHFAVESIGRWVLGRYWSKATETQRAEYLKLFEDLVVATYVDRFAEYSGERLVVERTAKAGDQDVVVHTVIARPQGGDPIDVGWRVRLQGNAFKIVDVMAGGISMGQTQRSEFASVIRRNGGDVEGLLVELRKRSGGG